MQSRFDKPESAWDEATWTAYDETLKYCRDHGFELRDYGDYFGIYAPTLEDFKSEKLGELRAAFDKRVSGTIDAHDYQMQFDISDSLKMQGAIQLLEATGATEGYLTQADDTTIYHVPLAMMKTVLVEMLAAYAQCHARKQALRAAINAAQTNEDLDAVVISWPV